jgi:hypothetical protein
MVEPELFFWQEIENYKMWWSFTGKRGCRNYFLPLKAGTSSVSLKKLKRHPQDAGAF